MAGIFISRGMSIRIPAGGLTVGIGSDGKPFGTATLHLRFDVCPTWAQLAIDHLREANSRSTARTVAWSSGDERAKAASLEREFESAMQAIMAAAIALDEAGEGTRAREHARE